MALVAYSAQVVACGSQRVCLQISLEPGENIWGGKHPEVLRRMRGPPIATPPALVRLRQWEDAHAMPAQQEAVLDSARGPVSWAESASVTWATSDGRPTPPVEPGPQVPPNQERTLQLSAAAAASVQQPPPPCAPRNEGFALSEAGGQEPDMLMRFPRPLRGVGELEGAVSRRFPLKPLSKRSLHP